MFHFVFLKIYWAVPGKVRRAFKSCLYFFAAQLFICNFVIFGFLLNSRLSSNKVLWFLSLQPKTITLYGFQKISVLFGNFNHSFTLYLSFFSIKCSFFCEQNSTIFIISVQNSYLGPQGDQGTKSLLLQKRFIQTIVYAKLTILLNTT